MPEPLQAAEHQHGDARLQVQRVIDRAHQVDQLLVDDADDLLAGVERSEHLLAQRLLADPADEVLDDRIADVGFEQGLLHQRQPLAHVRFGQLALAAQALQAHGQTFLQGFEHGSTTRRWKTLDRGRLARLGPPEAPRRTHGRRPLEAAHGTRGQHTRRACQA